MNDEAQRRLLHSYEALTEASIAGSEAARQAFVTLVESSSSHTLEKTAQALSYAPRAKFYPWWDALRPLAPQLFLIRALAARAAQVKQKTYASYMRERRQLLEYVYPMAEHATSPSAKLDILDIIAELAGSELLEFPRRWSLDGSQRTSVVSADILIGFEESLTSKQVEQLQQVPKESQLGVRSRCVLLESQLQTNETPKSRWIGELAEGLIFAGPLTERACQLLEHIHLQGLTEGAQTGSGDDSQVIRALRSIYNARLPKAPWIVVRVAACAYILGDEQAASVLMEHLSGQRLDIRIAAFRGAVLGSDRDRRYLAIREAIKDARIRSSRLFEMLGELAPPAIYREIVAQLKAHPDNSSLLERMRDSRGRK